MEAQCTREPHNGTETVRSKIAADFRVWAARNNVAASAMFCIKLLLLQPGLQLALMIRICEAAGKIPFMGKATRRLIWYYSTRLFSSDFGVDVQIGGGLYLPHPYGIVVHGRCQLGQNVTLLQNVTIGLVSSSEDRLPVLGAGSVINAGACILGNVRIGMRAIVGANAVVLINVPDNCVAIGVPAKIIKQSVN